MNCCCEGKWINAGCKEHGLHSGYGEASGADDHGDRLSLNHPHTGRGDPTLRHRAAQHLYFDNSFPLLRGNAIGKGGR